MNPVTLTPAASSCWSSSDHARSHAPLSPRFLAVTPWSSPPAIGRCAASEAGRQLRRVTARARCDPGGVTRWASSSTTPPEDGVSTTPRRNRVDPWGDLHAVPDRGLFTGNRGCLVDSTGELARHHRGKLWITCLTTFPDRKHPLDEPHRWTPIFFLD